MIEAIPSEVVEIRREICARCPTPCAAPEPARRCSACPLSPPGWGEYGECKAQSFGLGDAVALVAEPIAQLSDALFGTKLVGCGSCAERRAALNRLMRPGP